jgi:predicted nuclease of predicted toxin-antitoxin system
VPGVRGGARAKGVELRGVKLLFDENLSPKLPEVLSEEYPGSVHVGNIGLRGADDQKIWHFGREQGFAIVSKDTDFRERSFVEGSPPKIIWLDVGNAGTPVIVDLLQRERRRVEAFEEQQT